MTYIQLMQTQGLSITAALVSYWLASYDYWMDYPNIFGNKTNFDYRNEAEKCMREALSFVN